MSTRRNFKFTYVIQIYGIRWQSDDDTSAIRIHIQRGREVEVCVEASHFSPRQRRRPSPIRHKIPCGSNRIVNCPLLESSNRSLINCYYFERFFLHLWLLWELIINEREGESFLLWLLIIKERESFSIGNRNSVSIYYYYFENDFVQRV